LSQRNVKASNRIFWRCGSRKPMPKSTRIGSRPWIGAELDGAGPNPPSVQAARSSAGRTPPSGGAQPMPLRRTRASAKAINRACVLLVRSEDCQAVRHGRLRLRREMRRRFGLGQPSQERGERFKVKKDRYCRPSQRRTPPCVLLPRVCRDPKCVSLPLRPIGAGVQHALREGEVPDRLRSFITDDDTLKKPVGRGSRGAARCSFAAHRTCTSS
jgi:hypothetical protein